MPQHILWKCRLWLSWSFACCGRLSQRLCLPTIRKLEKAVAISFRGPPGGSRGKLLGKSWEDCWKSRDAANSRISGTGKGKPAGNLHCQSLAPTFCAGCFLKLTVPAFSSFSERAMKQLRTNVSASSKPTRISPPPPSRK